MRSYAPPALPTKVPHSDEACQPEAARLVWARARMDVRYWAKIMMAWEP